MKKIPHIFTINYVITDGSNPKSLNELCELPQARYSQTFEWSRFLEKKISVELPKNAFICQVTVLNPTGEGMCRDVFNALVNPSRQIQIPYLNGRKPRLLIVNITRK